MRAMTPGSLPVRFPRARWAFLILLLGIRAMGGFAAVAPDASLATRSVLILHAHERTLPAYEKADPALLEVLEAAGIKGSNLYIEYLDLRRNPSPAFLNQTAEYLQLKYGKRKIDVIVTMHLSSFVALFDPRFGLFEGIPIISTLSASAAIPRPELHPLIFQGESYDLAGTVELALDLLPRTEEVLVVAGIHPSDWFLERETRKQLAKYEGRLRISYLSHLPGEEMLRRTSAPPPNTVILYLSVFEDVAGKQFVPRELLTEICASAGAPVFSIHDAVLESGIVGGSMVSYAANAARAGRRALAILRGAGIGERAPGVSANRPMFHWRALQRWKLDAGRLPGNSVVVGRPLTIWHQYRGYVVGAVCLTLVEALLIAALSWQIRRRGRAERELRESQERFQRVLESSRDAAYQYNLEAAVFEYLSPVASRMLGCESSEVPALSGPTSPERIHPEDRERFRAVAASLNRREVADYQVEYRFLRQDKEYSWIDDSGTILRDGQGRARFLTGSLRDITERKRSEEEKGRLEAQLLQAQKLESVGRLAGGVAHDFNNILTVINGYGEMVAGALRPSDPVRAFVEQICQAGERASRLTQQLLTFSRKQMVRPQPLSLSVAVAESTGMLRRLMGEDILLRTLLDPGLGLVLADRGQVDQVLMNLAANARDAMPEGGELLVQTANVEIDEGYLTTHQEAVPGPAVLLAVTDTGIGMTEEVRQHIFEPFYTTKGIGQGTGLGLATVYGIVQQSRGWIWLYSEPGKGSTFKLYFPRLGEGTSGQTVLQPAVSQAGGTETILVVEDQNDVRALAVASLRSRGYVVIEAANGPEALRLAERQPDPIDVMVTDVVMPGMSGGELASQLKHKHPETRVIYTSGYTEDAVVTRGISTREVEFLPKPYSPAALLAAIRSALARGVPDQRS